MDPLGFTRHDHDQCRSHGLHSAEEVCAREGLSLTPQRRRVLEILLRRQGRVVPKKNVEDHIFGLSGEVASNAVEVYVSRLRKLLAEHQAKIIIHTIRGVGYLMAEEK